MAGRSQEKRSKGFKQDREHDVNYFIGSPEERFKGMDEAQVPYKLEPSTTAIEDFLTRLRQEGL